MRTARRRGVPRRVDPDDDVERGGRRGPRLRRARSSLTECASSSRRTASAAHRARRAHDAEVLVLDGVLQVAPLRATLALLAVDADDPWGTAACPRVPPRGRPPRPGERPAGRRGRSRRERRRRPGRCAGRSRAVPTSTARCSAGTRSVPCASVWPAPWRGPTVSSDSSQRRGMTPAVVARAAITAPSPRQALDRSRSTSGSRPRSAPSTPARRRAASSPPSITISILAPCACRQPLALGHAALTRGGCGNNLTESYDELRRFTALHSDPTA